MPLILPPPRALWTSARLDRLWARGWATRPPLDPDAIIAAAMRAERSATPPADGGWRQRLDLLCADLVAHADLSSLGRTIAYGQLVRIIRSRLRAERLWRRHPAILDRPLTAPVAIIGQMRSGTTRLHRLLACLPDLAHTRLYETLDPIPGGGMVPRPLRAALTHHLLLWLNPDLAAVHPTSALAAEEEFGLHGFSLWGTVFDAQYHLPRFAAHCQAADPADVYAEFARLVRTIGWARGDSPDRRWLWKAPQFMADLGPLICAFPDVQLVLARRDPARVVASSASLVAQQRRVQGRSVDPAALGETLTRTTLHREAACRAALVRHPAAVVATVDFAAMDDDWRHEITRIAAAIGIAVPSSAWRAMAAIADARRHHGHDYRADDFALDNSDLTARFAQLPAI